MVWIELGVASIDTVAEDLVTAEVGGDVLLWSDRGAKSGEGTDDKDSTIRLDTFGERLT